MNTYPRFGSLLNEYLFKLDRTPAWLARRLGVNAGTVSRWLNEDARPGSPETVVRIADVLGITAQRDKLLVAAGYGYQASNEDEANNQSSDKPDDKPTVKPTVKHNDQGKTPDLLASLPSPRHNLPVQTTPFVGRQRDVDELALLLDDPEVRLLTILGPGGMGKTRLALEVAGRYLGEYQHGVYFVPPALQAEADALPELIAGALGYQFLPDVRSPKEQLVEYLRGKHLLLVLDSFEHLLSGAALLHELLQSAPRVRIIATSRERLKLSGETLFRLSGMDLPAQESAPLNNSGSVNSGSVQLFLQGVRRLRPSYVPSGEEDTAIQEICRLTQGMPLAILLAAAWIEMLSPQEIAAEIAQSTSFLAAELRDLPVHQRSIAAILTQTWEQLSENERAVLPRLSLFRAGFTRQAAQAVSGASLLTLSSLADKALLWRNADGRYTIHELLGQYAAEKLSRSGFEEASRETHCAYFVSLLATTAPKLKGEEQAATLNELEQERENLRAAWRYALERKRVEWLAEGAEGFFRFNLLRGYFREGEALCESTIAVVRSSANRQFLAQLLTWQGSFCRRLGRPELARELCRQSLELLSHLTAEGHDTQADRAAALLLMGDLMWYVDADAAHGMLLESLSICRMIADEWTAAAALRELGRVAFESGEYQQSRQYAQECLLLWRRCKDLTAQPPALALLTWLSERRGQHEQASAYAQEYYEIAQQTGSRTLMTQALFNMSIPLVKSGQFSDGLTHLERSREIAQELGDRHHLSTLDLHRAEAKLHLGHYAEADSLAQAIVITAREIGLHQHGAKALNRLAELRLLEGAYQEAEGLLDESASIYVAARATLHLILVYVTYGYVAYYTKNLNLARRTLSLAWHYASKQQDYSIAVELLPLAALFMLDRRIEGRIDPADQEDALEFYAAAFLYPNIANSQWYAELVGRVMANAAQKLPHLAAAQQRGKTKTIEELLAAMGKAFARI